MRVLYSHLGLVAWCALLSVTATLHATQPQPFTTTFDTQLRRLPAVEPSSNTDVSPVSYSHREFLASRMEMLEAELAELRNMVGKGDSGGSSGSGSSGVGPVMPGHSASKMKVVGRVHADAWHFPHDSPGINEIENENPGLSPQDRLGFRRMRFGVRGKLPVNMEYRIEMEFAGGNQSEFRDAWLGFNDLSVLQKVLIGNQKRPYGLDHLNSSRYNVFLERPFVIESFNQDARRLGIVSYGVSDDQAWNWRYGVYNQRLIQDEGNYISDHLQLEFAGRLANTIWYDECSGGRGYAHWAVSGTIAQPDGTGLTPPRDTNEARFRHRPEARSVNRWIDTGVIAGADEYRMLGTEAAINVGRIQFVGEYQNLWLDRDPGFGGQVHLHGGYCYVSYFLTGEHIPWSRSSGTLGRVKPFENFFLVDRCNGGRGWGLGAWQIAARYSYVDFNDQNVFGGEGESFTFGVNWHWNPYARLQFNYIYGEIDNRDSNSDDSSEPVNLVSGDYGIIGARAMVDF